LLQYGFSLQKENLSPNNTSSDPLHNLVLSSGDEKEMRIFLTYALLFCLCSGLSQFKKVPKQTFQEALIIISNNSSYNIELTSTKLYHGSFKQLPPQVLIPTYPFWLSGGAVVAADPKLGQFNGSIEYTSDIGHVMGFNFFATCDPQNDCEYGWSITSPGSSAVYQEFFGKICYAFFLL